MFRQKVSPARMHMSGEQLEQVRTLEYDRKIGTRPVKRRIAYLGLVLKMPEG